MTSKALVGPVRTVRFHDGTKQIYDVPRDSLDLRYRLCRKHRPACDCREAEIAEQMGEYATERRAVELAAQRLLVGHRVKDYADADLRPRDELGDELWWRYVHGDGPLACQCTGCQLVRAADLRICTDDAGLVTEGPVQ